MDELSPAERYEVEQALTLDGAIALEDVRKVLSLFPAIAMLYGGTINENDGRIVPGTCNPAEFNQTMRTWATLARLGKLKPKPVEAPKPADPPARTEESQPDPPVENPIERLKIVGW